MMPPPPAIDGATVLQVADLFGTAPTGVTRHVVDGSQVAEFAGLAVAQYEDDQEVYLFYCDEQWRCVTDTVHSSESEAVHVAAMQFENVVFSRPG